MTISGIPATDSALPQLGILVEVRLDSTLAGMGTCRFVVDGAVQFGSACDRSPLDFASTAPAAGAHTAEFAFMRATAGSATVDTTFSFTTVATKLDPYSATVLQPLGGDQQASASDMNDSGIVVGSSVAPDGTSRPVRWVLGQPSELPTSGAAQGTATSVNASGTIVGILGPWLADSAVGGLDQERFSHHGGGE